MDKELIAALDASIKREGGFKFVEHFGWVGDSIAAPNFNLWGLEAFIGKSLLDIPRALLKEEQGIRYFGITGWGMLKHILNDAMSRG